MAATNTAKKNETNEVKTETATDQTSQTPEVTTGNENEVKAEEAKEPVTFEVVNEKSVAQLAKDIVSRVAGEKNDERSEVVNSLIKALRAERDAGRNKRETKELKDIIADIMNKPLAELQAVRVPIAGITLTIPALVKVANSNNPSVLKAPALSFMNEHKFKAVETKKKSRGKATTFIRPLDYKEPAAETTKPEEKAA
jgi:hypothetical protein